VGRHLAWTAGDFIMRRFNRKSEPLTPEQLEEEREAFRERAKRILDQQREGVELRRGGPRGWKHKRGAYRNFGE